MEIKNYLVFQETFTDRHQIYVWNEEEKWWLLPDGSGNGFSPKKVEENFSCRRFNLFDTEEEAKEYIRYKKYAYTHGPREKQYYDFTCPKCGYQHEDNRDFEGYSYNCPEDDFSVECFCGHRILVSVKMTYTVEE